jgi:hypothetical protein
MSKSIVELYGSKAGRLIKFGSSISDLPQDEKPRRGIKFKVDRADLPIPAVARAVLLLLGAKDYGRSEKTAFELAFSFDGVPCLFALRKFGLDVAAWLPEDASDDDKAAFSDRFIKTLQRLIRIAETDIFYPAIKREIASGELGVTNNAGSLHRQYKYFREGALLGFDKKGRMQPPEPEVGNGDGVDDWGKQFAYDFNSDSAAKTEGSFNASAMVNSYFSYLEHYLSIVLPFTEIDLKSFDLQRFFGDSWSAKFKTVIDISDPNTKLIYDRLVHVSETYRNPLAHGGWDKRGPTASVRVEGLGRMPLLLSGIERTVGFRMEAVASDDFAEICELFDEAEELLKGPLLGNGPVWIGWGFDVFFDAKERAAYHSGPDAFERHMSRRSDAWERAVNMDW